MENKTVQKLKNGQVIDREWEFYDLKCKMTLKLVGAELRLYSDFSIDPNCSLSDSSTDLSLYNSGYTRDLSVSGCFFGPGSWRTNTANGSREGYEGYLIVGALWEGPEPSQLASINNFTAWDGRLEALFANERLKRIDISEDKFDEVATVVGPIDELWIKPKGPKYTTKLKEKDTDLSISASVSTSTSNTSGESSRHIRQFSFNPYSSIKLGEALNMVGGIEDLISILTLSPFTFEEVSFLNSSNRKSCKLLWHSSRAKRVFEPEGFHGLVLPSISPSQFEQVFAGWFTRTENEKLATILFLEAIKSETGLGRFTPLAQAFEVLGRDLTKSKGIDKSKMKSAILNIKKAITDILPQEFIARIVTLVQSSNQQSYRDILISIFQNTEQKLSYTSYRPISDIAADINKARNLLFHMSTSNVDKINETLGDSIYISMELMFWFQLVFLSSTGIQLDTSQIERARLNHKKLYPLEFWIKAKKNALSVKP